MEIPESNSSPKSPEKSRTNTSDRGKALATAYLYAFQNVIAIGRRRYRLFGYAVISAGVVFGEEGINALHASIFWISLLAVSIPLGLALSYFLMLRVRYATDYVACIGYSWFNKKEPLAGSPQESIPFSLVLDAQRAAGPLANGLTFGFVYWCAGYELIQQATLMMNMHIPQGNELLAPIVLLLPIRDLTHSTLLYYWKRYVIPRAQKDFGIESWLLDFSYSEKDRARLRMAYGPYFDMGTGRCRLQARENRQGKH